MALVSVPVERAAWQSANWRVVPGVYFTQQSKPAVEFGSAVKVVTSCVDLFLVS